jgi:hypothetical protein
MSHYPSLVSHPVELSQRMLEAPVKAWARPQGFLLQEGHLGVCSPEVQQV